MNGSVREIEERVARSGGRVLVRREKGGIHWRAVVLFDDLAGIGRGFGPNVAFSRALVNLERAKRS